jgi:chromosome segregation ATPase
VLYDIEQIAELTGVSKVTIYKKIKLKDVKPFIVKKEGKTYVEEEAINLIKQSIKFTAEDNLDIDSKDIEEDMSADYTKAVDELINTKNELINSLQQQVQFLQDQLTNKDRLMENMQVLLKQEKEQPESLLALEEHVKEVDNKLIEIRERMQERQENTRSFWGWFKK